MVAPSVSLLLITALAHLALGMLVYFKNRKALINRLVFGLSISAALWCIAVLFIILQQQYAPILFWVRASHAAAILIPWPIFALAVAFSENNSWQRHKFWLWITGLLCVGFSVLSFTPLIVKDIALPLERKEIVVGLLFYLYSALFLGIILTALKILYSQLLSSKGLLRLQLRYLFWGITLSLLMGSLSNMLLPLIDFTAIDLRSFGPVFSIIMIGAISYAIVKYRLMDIRLFLRNSLAIIVSVSFFSLMIAFVYYVQDLVDLPNILGFVLVVAGVLIVALYFAPLQTKAQNFFDRHFFRGVYDYHISLLKSSKVMVSLLSMEKLIDFISRNLFERMQLENCSFFGQDKEGVLRLTASYYADGDRALAQGTVIPGEDPLLNYLRENSELLLLSDFQKISPPAYRNSLTRTIHDLHSEAIMPIVLDGKLEGIFLLGSKLSGEPYTREDENLLNILIAQITVAWRNAQLYQEILSVKQHLENVLTNMGSALIAVNSKGLITLFNSTAERFTGRKEINMLGRKAEDLLDNGLGSLIQQAFTENRDIKEVEQTFRTYGKELHLSCNITLVGEDGSRDKGAIMLLSDITRIKELQKEKAQALRFASMGEVAAGMAHEIKNPLVSIKTFAELLPEKYDDAEFRYTFSHIVIQEIDRINALVMQLLDLTANPLLRFEKTRLEDIMDEVLLLLFPYLERQQILLTKAYDAGLPAVNIDRNQIKQALFNICLNGIQSMPSGGELKIGLMSAMPEKYGRRSSANAKGVKVIIKDTGAGVPEEITHRIFDPFFTTKADGMGMGLSISHKTLVAHGGTIELRSDGDGTVFTIYIPGLSE